MGAIAQQADQGVVEIQTEDTPEGLPDSVRASGIVDMQLGTQTVPPPTPAPTKKKTTTSLRMPTVGKNWGALHAHNGVDIANVCGTKISAAAAGVVTEVRFGWNGGYGTAVMVRHRTGVETYYAHLASTAVQEGDRIEAGDLIGAMGDTGRATGCHLHFEVHGAINPFAH